MTSPDKDLQSVPMPVKLKTLPKVFISYSWSGQSRQEIVKEWADRLISDGVNVTVDLYDLREGQDKNSFMEKMVNDPEITNVLVISDKSYAEKADARIKGVGTESQIISQELYSNVDQLKFIPIVCEFSDGEPTLPVFMKSRIWIDFSSPELVNTNWERLIRILHGKPLLEKPALGKTPTFLLEESTPSSPARAKFSSLKQAILQGKPGLGIFRRDFLDACIESIDALRIRARPDVQITGEKVLADCDKLIPIRDLITDWVLLEAEAAPSPQFTESLNEFLERLREMKARPPELNSWNDAWFEAHSLFVYETFIYIVASLLKTKAFLDLNTLFTSHYIIPKSERFNERTFDNFEVFYATSETLQAVLAPPQKRLMSPAAELIKRHATRSDLPFEDLIQADLMILLMSFIQENIRWYPQLLIYASFHYQFPFFLRATQHKHFKNLAIITGIETVSELRKLVSEGHERAGTRGWHHFDERNFLLRMNVEKWDTLK